MPTDFTLSATQSELVGRCLRAVVEGPFFEDAEFPELFGVSKAEARAVAAGWPNVSGTDETVTSAVNNMLLNLFGYPHADTAAWDRLIGVAPIEIQRAWRRWKASTSLPMASHE